MKRSRAGNPREEPLGKGTNVAGEFGFTKAGGSRPSSVVDRNYFLRRARTTIAAPAKRASTLSPEPGSISGVVGVAEARKEAPTIKNAMEAKRDSLFKILSYASDGVIALVATPLRRIGVLASTRSSQRQTTENGLLGDT